MRSAGALQGHILYERVYGGCFQPYLCGDANVDASGPSLKQKVYRELKEYLAISCYLWLVFGLFVLYESVILAEHQIPFAAKGLALINALALGKIMLIAEDLHFADRFKNEPLIYPTLFKSAAFALILGCFKIVEEAGIGLYHGKGFSESITSIGGGTLKGILTMMALLGVLLIPFFGFTELREVVGKEKLRKLFFTSRDFSGTSS
jgi:hypothetical protein